MPVETEPSTRFMDEIRIISPWAYFFAALGVAVVGAVVVFAALTDKSGAPFYTLPVLVPVGLLSGTTAACFILLIGYINRDARRRGMSSLAWTLLAIFIPNALGIVLYFVLRKPLTLNCPQCGMIVEPGFGFCPQCRCRLNAVCPQCQHSANANDKYCSYCGRGLVAGVDTISPPPPRQS